MVPRFPTPDGRPPRSLVRTVLILAGLLIASAPLVELNPRSLVGAGTRLLEFLGHLWVVPDWSYLPDLGQRMLETIEMAVIATVIALVLSLPLAVLSARNVSPHPLVFALGRGLLSLIRALPELVWALVFVSAVGLGPLPGILALAVVTVGFMGKVFAEAIEVVDPRPVEGVAAHGARRLQVLGFAILPQALPDLLGSTLYVLDHNVRAAAILGLVGAGGIGYDMVMAMRVFEYDRLVLIGAAIWLCVTLLDRASHRLRARVIDG